MLRAERVRTVAQVHIFYDWLSGPVQYDDLPHSTHSIIRQCVVEKRSSGGIYSKRSVWGRGKMSAWVGAPYDAVESPS